MNEAHEQALGKAGLGWITAVTFLVFYVLSIGPVGALTKNTPGPALYAVHTIYYPVIWLHDHTPLKGPLEAYGKIWGF